MPTVLATEPVSHEHAAPAVQGDRRRRRPADPAPRHHRRRAVHADPAGDVGAPALALDAELVIAGAGRRAHRAGGATSSRTSSRPRSARASCSPQIRVPKHTGWGVALREVRPRLAPVVDRRRRGVGASRPTAARSAEARIGLTNMGSTPLRARAVEEALVGRPATDEPSGAAVASVADGTNPPSDLNGDADYRRHLATVLTRRAVLAALEADRRMELTHSFTVPTARRRRLGHSSWTSNGWASCFPGATVTSVDDDSVRRHGEGQARPDRPASTPAPGSSSSATTRRTAPSSRPRARTSGATARPAPR